MNDSIREFVLFDAAILQASAHFDALIRCRAAVSLYGDLSSYDSHRFGPWLLEGSTFDAIVPANTSLAVPWRYGISRLTTGADLSELVAHFESQRTIAMAAGDRYYLRFADTRALATLERVLTSGQTRQLKGPVAHWRYLDRFDAEREFGEAVSSEPRRQNMIVLSEVQGERLLELQFAQALADDVHASSGGDLAPHLVAAQYQQIEVAALFVLEQGIEPFEVQRHVAAVTVKTGGALLTDARFLEAVRSARTSGRWHELMKWRGV
ncbi:DUF4123 domain-containing protein [Paraburkholderia madseniana]|uniref:DUF4123 domain-containing protein n=1 Tax=Paraburkholderia madseniana TaxID=2599607 RepID=UPI0015586DBA|nr:DUF4123 domain-containing protein [Paraburkholderia madseniana]NPT66983.1 DUF4123 domain-containing protein [Paraburkholderia madseniana]